MPINNTPKPITTLNNVSKINIGETWATILTTWASETRTWAGIASLIENFPRTTSTINNVARPI